jgi:hypothetical protein
MEMGQDDVGNLVRREAKFPERALEGSRFVIDPENVFEFGVVFVAKPVIDDHQPTIAFEEQTPHGQLDPVPLVGVGTATPEGFRHNAEHGTAIQSEEAGFDFVDSVGADSGHGSCYRLSVIGYRLSVIGNQDSGFGFSR